MSRIQKSTGLGEVVGKALGKMQKEAQPAPAQVGQGQLGETAQGIQDLLNDMAQWANKRIPEIDQLLKEPDLTQVNAANIMSMAYQNANRYMGPTAKKIVATVERASPWDKGAINPFIANTGIGYVASAAGDQLHAMYRAGAQGNAATHEQKAEFLETARYMYSVISNLAQSFSRSTVVPVLNDMDASANKGREFRPFGTE